MQILSIDRRPSTRGGIGPFPNAGTPTNGVSEVQTITVNGTPTGGTFKLKFKNQITAALAYNATSAAVQTALRALSSIGSGGVTVTGSGGGPYSVTFTGALGKLDQPLIELFTNSLTGGTNPTVAITVATAGVDATARGASPGAMVIDTTNGVAYQNAGTGIAPSWVMIGKIAKVPLVANDAAGGILSWQNPEVGAILVHRLILDVTTPATGACTADFGATAVTGATSIDNLIDGLDIHTAAGVFDNVDDHGTDGKAKQKVAAGKWITGSKASGAAAGLVGNAYIHYFDI